VEFGAEEELVVRRRKKRERPMRTHRVGVHLHAQPAAAGAAAGALDFPGITIPEPDDSRRRWWTSLLSLLIHASILGALVLWALYGPQEIEEKLIEVKILNEPQAERTDPAPARRVLAERRSPVFRPQAQAVKPQVVNPRVVARAVPQVAAQRIDMNNVSPVAAPRQVSRAAVSVEKVATVRSVGPAATTERVNLEAAAGPALRGPREIEAPAGPSVGPRQVARVGDTIGVGSVQRQGDGSSVREGIASNRDVLGSPTGPRLANVNTNVGEGLRDGSGGTGQGGVSFSDCFQRPEVQEYWTAIERRMYARWVLPPDVSSNQQVKLRFQLDAAGSARSVQLIPGGDGRLGKSAVDALRSAAPFPPMSDRVRCLAGAPIVGTFRNPLASGVN
jgi:hypothetical protein